MAKVFKNANFPRDASGAVYHLGVRDDEVAPRVLTVGDVGRADRIAALPDFHETWRNTSSRGFVCIRGTWKGEDVSIATSLMGFPNMDFLVRELRATISGPMAMVRFGTCGTPATHVRVGDFMVASEGAFCIIRNPDAFDATLPEAERPEPYMFSRLAYPDAELSSTLIENLKTRAAAAGTRQVHGGVGASADTFYASQGRTSDQFDDRNADLVDRLVAYQPHLVGLEMESFELLDMARVCREPIHAAACALILAQRRSNDFLSDEDKYECEAIGGAAALDTLIAFKL